MNLNFELILVLLLGGCALIIIGHWIFRRTSKWAQFARSMFPILLIVLVIRSFLVEPFRIPSGSLKPTLKIGDFILVNKFNYGLRLPVGHQQLIGSKQPKRGDIVVFRWPPAKNYDFIKRVIGVPGDTIEYHNQTLTINGKIQPQQLMGYAIDQDHTGQQHKVAIYQELLAEHKHKIYRIPQVKAFDFAVTVPKNFFFVMGDNRDASSDSRYWGFISQQDLIGRAFFIWMSYDSRLGRVRWSRIGQTVH